MQTTMFYGFHQVLHKKTQNVCDFVEKASKLIDLVETTRFSCRLPSFRVFIRFWAKTCKKCGIWWKLSKLIDLAKTSNFLCKLSSMFYQVLRKKLQKVSDFVKNHQNSSTWSKLETFCANYHVLGISSSFEQKV